MRAKIGEMTTAIIGLIGAELVVEPDKRGLRKSHANGVPWNIVVFPYPVGKLIKRSRPFRKFVSVVCLLSFWMSQIS